MSQIALPLAGPDAGPRRIVVGNANAAVIDAFAHADRWPFRTAVLSGPPRSGKSLLARWLADSTGGDVIDDADARDEADVFHRWNRAQETATPLLLVRKRTGSEWRIALPDLASRLGAALHLEIGAPDDAMLAELILLHAEQRGLPLGDAATAYLVPRCERSHIAAEKLVRAIDRLSLERKQPPTLAIWRDALEEIAGKEGGVVRPRLP